MHDFFIEPICHRAEFLGLHFIHAESLDHLEADKGLLIGRRDLRNRVLNPR